MIALLLHLCCESEQRTHGRKEDRCGLFGVASAHDATYRLSEEEGRAIAGGPYAHIETDDVHAFGHLAHRNHPTVITVVERLNALTGLGIV